MGPHEAPRPRQSTPGHRHSKTALLFPGQGSQFVGMGLDVYRESKAARLVFDEAAAALDAPSCPGSLRDAMFHGPASTLTRTSVAQPAILVHSIALLRALEAESLPPFVVGQVASYAAGHSLGEFTALVATGALDLWDAVRLVAARGQAMEACEREAEEKTRPSTERTHCMKALLLARGKLPEVLERVATLASALAPDQPPSQHQQPHAVVQVANVNSSGQIVLSGTLPEVEEVVRLLQEERLVARAVDLPVSGAFHSPLMQPAKDTMRKLLEEVKFKRPCIPVLSNVTGLPVRGCPCGSLISNACNSPPPPLIPRKSELEHLPSPCPPRYPAARRCLGSSPRPSAAAHAHGPVAPVHGVCPSPGRG
jgi:[acyl-carrier-protein] S-malonyltransferase